MFLGVDDELDSEGINNICIHLKKNKPDILAFSTKKIYDDSNKNMMEILKLNSITNFKNPGIYIYDIYTLYKKLGKDALFYL